MATSLFSEGNGHKFQIIFLRVFFSAHFIIVMIHNCALGRLVEYENGKTGDFIYEWNDSFIIITLQMNIFAVEP